MNKDLTTGKPEKVLWQFCLPLFGSIIFQQLYNIADSFVAGKFISDNALAAVGNSYEITLIFIAFAFGCNIACSVLAALFFGAKQYNDLKTTVYTALISSCVICAVLMLVGTLCCDSLLRLIKTPEEVFADSKLYLDIYIYGLPFVFLYNVATGIFSALGDSKTPFIFLACSSTSNIAVDILFVTAFNMGVAGVAWATFLCQGISCVLALVVVFRRFAKIPTEGKVKICSWNHFGRFAVIAIPSILQQSFISVGNIIIQSVINSFGAAVMAGYSAAVKLNNMVITSLTTLGNGISNYTAQNLGAAKYDRIRAGFRAGLKLVWALCVPLVLVTFLFFIAVKSYGKPDAMPFADVATAIVGGIVFPLMYSSIFLLRMDPEYGRMYVLLPFCVAFIGDSLSMYGGMLFGKRKMAPHVSPHKTWAGAIAGLLGGALGLVLWGVVAHAWLGYEPDYLSLALAGLTANAIGQLGDLSMSLIKREAGVKDYSHIFLTHGGMLDRFDSTLFIAPWLYLFVCAGL